MSVAAEEREGKRVLKASHKCEAAVIGLSSHTRTRGRIRANHICEKVGRATRHKTNIDVPPEAAPLLLSVALLPLLVPPLVDPVGVGACTPSFNSVRKDTREALQQGLISVIYKTVGAKVLR